MLTLKAGNVNAADVKAYSENENVKKVVAAEGAVFPEDCSDLFRNFKAQEIDLSKADTSNVTTMEYMFSICGQLTDLDLQSFDTSKVKQMGSMFKYCSSLKYIFVGDKWDTASVNGSSDMFYACNALVGEKGTKFNSKYKDSTYARIDEPGTPGYFSESTVFFSAGNGVLTLKDCHINAEDVKAYAGNEAVTKVVAEEGTVLPKDCSSLFMNFSKVQEIDLSKADSSNVTNTDNIFLNCSDIEKITLDFSVSKNMALPNSSYYWVNTDDPNTIVSGTGGNAVIDVSGTAALERVKGFQFDVGGKCAAPNGQVFDGENCTVTKPTAPTAEGYTFSGWFKDNTFTEYFDFDTPITESTVIYAKWLSDNGENTIIFSDFVKPAGTPSERMQSINPEEPIVCELVEDVQDCSICLYTVSLNGEQYKDLYSYSETGYINFTIDKETVADLYQEIIGGNTVTIQAVYNTTGVGELSEKVYLCRPLKKGDFNYDNNVDKADAKMLSDHINGTAKLDNEPY